MSTTPLPEVPGFVVTERRDPKRFADLGLDELGAVEQGTRERVDLLVLPELRAAEREQIGAALAPFAEVSSPALGRPARLAEGVDALVLPAADYVTLDALAPEVRPSSSGHVVTLVVPLAQGLDALHELGLAHGGVAEGLVSIDTSGRAQLLGAGARAALHALAPREVAQPSITDDRDQLLALLERLTEEVDDAQLSRVTQSLLADGAGPGEVAERLLGELDPAPLGEHEPADAVPATSVADGGEPGGVAVSDGRTAPATRRPRWLTWAALGVVGVVGAVAVVWLLASGDDDATTAAARSDLPLPAGPTVPSATASAPGSAEPTAAPTATATAQATPALGTQLCGAPAPAPDQAPELAEDWTEVIDELYLRRSAALVTGQTSLLCDVYDPLSPGLLSDIELDAAYAEQGVRPDSLVFVVEAATLVEQDGARLVVEISDSLDPYVLLGDDGRVVAELAGIGSETWQARLVPDSTGTEWRFG